MQAAAPTVDHLSSIPVPTKSAYAGPGGSCVDRDAKPDPREHPHSAVGPCLALDVAVHVAIYFVVEGHKGSRQIFRTAIGVVPSAD